MLVELCFTHLCLQIPSHLLTSHSTERNLDLFGDYIKLNPASRWAPLENVCHRGPTIPVTCKSAFLRLWEEAYGVTHVLKYWSSYPLGKLDGAQSSQNPAGNRNIPSGMDHKAGTIPSACCLPYLLCLQER